MLPSSKNTMPDVENIEPHNNTSGNLWADKTPYIKRPLNAYRLWCRHQKPAVIKSRPDLKPFEIKKLLTSEWKLLTAEEKQPFTDEALKLKFQYYCTLLYNLELCNKSSEPKCVPRSSSPTSLTKVLISNTVSTSDDENKSNDPKDSILLQILSFTKFLFRSGPAKATASHIKIPQRTGRQSCISMTASNAQSKAAVPYEHECIYPGQNTSRKELNPGDYVHTYTRGLSWPEHPFIESQPHNEESPLDLSVKKNW